MINMKIFAKKRRILQVAILLVGIAMITKGIVRGEAREIMRKAIVVCMECIGIG